MAAPHRGWLGGRPVGVRAAALRYQRLRTLQIAAAASDYATLLGLKSDAKTLRGAKQRLLNLAAPPSLFEEIERTREVPLTFTWTAPRNGIVLERSVVPGMRVMPGEVLFRIADHSSVWAMVDVAEETALSMDNDPIGGGPNSVVTLFQVMTDSISGSR